jgi:hypothetical protein
MLLPCQAQKKRILPKRILPLREQIVFNLHLLGFKVKVIKGGLN